MACVPCSKTFWSVKGLRRQGVYVKAYSEADKLIAAETMVAWHKRSSHVALTVLSSVDCGKAQTSERIRLRVVSNEIDSRGLRTSCVRRRCIEFYEIDNFDLYSMQCALSE